MRFHLSEEQEMLQETVRQFLENECPVTRLRELFDGDEDFDPVLWKGMREPFRSSSLLHCGAPEGYPSEAPVLWKGTRGPFRSS